ncbi:MAG TPA: MFS transporter [Candidatus Binatia bacterium]|jgi:MFS family permease
MPPSRTQIPRAFWIVSAANFLSFLNIAFFFLLPLWVDAHGGGPEKAGRIGALSGFAGLAALPLIGYLLDRFGRRRFMITGIGVSALCSACFMFVDDFGPALWALRIVQGIASTSAFTGAQTLALLFAPVERRAATIGWFGISTILTNALSPAIGESIVHQWGFRTMFGVGAVLGSCAFVLSCFVPRPPAFVMLPRSVEIEPRLARRAVATATVAMMCYGFGFGATQTFVPLLMKQLEIGRVGPFFTAWSLAAVSVRAVFGTLSDRIGRRGVILPAMAALTLAVALLSITRSMMLIVTIGAIFGMGHGLLYPTMNAWVADWSTASNIGRTQSLFSGSYSLGISSCAFLFGTIVERYGYSTMFLVASAISLVGMLVFITGPGSLPGEPAHESLADTSSSTGEI